MAVRDARFFKLLFEPNGAIDQFLRNPNRNFTIVRGYFISKRSMLRLIRHILPRYKVYQEDKDLVQQLYLNKNTDFYIRSLLNPAAAPVLTPQHLDEFENFSQNTALDLSQKETAIQDWVTKITGEKDYQTPLTQPEPTLLTQIKTQINTTKDSLGISYLQRLPGRIPILIKRVIVHNIYPLKVARYYQVRAQTQLKRWLRRLPVTKLATSLIGASVGGSIAGLPGILAGGVGGWFAPTIISRGAGSLILRGGISLLSGSATQVLLGTGVRAVVSLALLSLPVTIAVLAVAVVAIIILIQPAPPSSAAPLMGSNVASCQFYRGGDPTPAQNYKSNLLIQYFQQAEQLTSVPAVLLAAVARVESPGVTNFTDEQIINYSCAESSTGARGIMQLQPPGTIGSVGTSLDQGARFLGKTVDQLIEVDFCSPRNSIIIAAGFILNKLQANGIGDGSKWDPTWTTNPKVINKIAESYYGCLEYGTSEKTASGTTKCAGPYNYGTDLWNSLQSCQVSLFATTVAPPADPDLQALRQDILNKFGVEMGSFNYNYLKWSWEKLWEVSNTKFLQLVKGQNSKITINRVDRGYNLQVNCSIITMSGQSSTTGQPYPESLFKVVFIHELAHIIENCSPDLANKNQLQQVINQEGYITNFSQNSNVCPGSKGDIPLNEDFADTISYYLNPEWPEQSIGVGDACEPQISTNPYVGGRKPLHQQFTQTLLGTSNTPVAKTDNLATLSCLVVGGGRNRLPSYQADPINGHCGSNYNSKLTNPADQCAGNTRRGKSIDIETGGADGKDVALPIMNGQPVSWQYINNITLAKSDCFEEEILNPGGLGGGCGTGYVFKTDLGGGKNWILHLLHMGVTNLQLGQTYPSGTLVGKTEAIHAHISVGQDIQNPLSQTESGWLSVDTQLHLCE